jgi:hypothetical protein
MPLFQNLMWLHPNFDLVFDLEMPIALSVNLWNLFSPNENGINFVYHNCV